MTFKGCFPYDYDPDVLESRCGEDKTVDSTDVKRYRHFAVDDKNDIIYVCDAVPTRPVSELACYSNNRADGSGRTWFGKFLFSRISSKCSAISLRKMLA